jgi:hypothetical protein
VTRPHPGTSPLLRLPEPSHQCRRRRLPRARPRSPATSPQHHHRKPRSTTARERRAVPSLAQVDLPLPEPSCHRAPSREAARAHRSRPRRKNLPPRTAFSSL